MYSDNPKEFPKKHTSRDRELISPQNRNSSMTANNPSEYSKPTTSREIISPQNSSQMVGLPTTIFDTESKVVIVKDFGHSGDCGILELQGSNAKVYCFFRGKDVRTLDSNISSRLSQRIPVGTRLKTNGKLIDTTGPIPYLASFVWEEGVALDQVVMSKIFHPTDPGDLEIYGQMAGTLSWQIPNIPSEDNSDIVILKESDGREKESNLLSESSKVIESSKEIDEILSQILPTSQSKEPKITKSSSRNRSRRRSRSRSSKTTRYSEPRRSKSRSRSRDGKSRHKYRSTSRDRRSYSRSRSRDRRRKSRSRSKSRGRRSVSRSRHKYRSSSRDSRSKYRHRSNSRRKDRSRSRSKEKRSRSRSYKSGSRKDRRGSRTRKRSSSRRRSPSLSRSPSRPRVLSPVNVKSSSKWTEPKPEKLPENSSHISFKLNAGKITTERKKSQEEPVKEEVFDSELNEVFDKENGAKGIIMEYISNQAGYLQITGQSSLIYFHINHVWIKHETLGYCKFLEIFPREKLSEMLPVGSTKLACNARAIKSERADFQATAVWLVHPAALLFKKRQSPPIYRSPDLNDDLNWKLHDLLYSETNHVKPVDPLTGAFEVATEAVVHEYISLETGLLQAVGLDGGIVLFHLNQVWVDDSDTTSQTPRLVKLSSVQNKDLQQGYLPIGTKVMVNFRDLPASELSELKYQATILWKCPSSNLGTIGIPDEFNNMYKSRPQREALVAELDQHFDIFKKSSRLDLSSTSSLFSPIPLVINTLPANWQAVVSNIVSENFGIIKISHSNPLSKLSHKDSTWKVNNFHVLFHLENVFDMNGIPSSNSPNLTMSSLLHQHVDLTARSGHNINMGTPMQLMELQKSLELEGVGDTPVLQAIAVYVIESPLALINRGISPRPTKLREEPGSFGSSTATSFFLNIFLKTRLNFELEEFMKIPNKKPLPYYKTIGTPLSKEIQVQRLQITEGVDSSNASQYLYGSFNPFSTIGKSEKFMPNLTQVQCRVKLLHRQGPNPLKSQCGLLEISVPTGSCHATTYAFFERSDYKDFFNNCDDTDLAQLMPLGGTDKLCLHAILAKSTSKVPYLATAVWNEDARRKLHKSQIGQVSKSKIDPLVKQKYGIIDEIIKEWSNKKIVKTEDIGSTSTSSNSKSYATVECKYWPKCTRKECPFFHPELTQHAVAQESLERVTQANKLLLQLPNSVGVVLGSDGNPPTNVNGEDVAYMKITAGQYRLLSKSALGTTSVAVVEYFNNVEGTVEKVLSDYYGVLKYEEHYMVKGERNIKHRKIKKVRVLFTSNDVFRRSHVTVTSRRDHTVEELYGETCEAKGVGLTEVLKAGDKVKFNAVILVMPEPNLSGINYYCTGVIIGSGEKNNVPVLPIRSCKLVISRAWKTRYGLVVNSLSSSLQIISGKESYLQQAAPKATVWSVSKLRLPHLQTWCGLGPANDDNDFVLKIPTITLKEEDPVEVNFEHVQQAIQKVREEEGKKAADIGLCPNVVVELTGRIINLIDSNYGIAVGFVSTGASKYNPVRDGRVVQVLFDIYDVWIKGVDETSERQPCASSGKTLPEVMQVGDYIKFHAVHIEQQDQDPGPRELRYMATAAITASTLDTLVRAQFPAHIKPVFQQTEISTNKIANFRAVAKVMSLRPINQEEKAFSEELRSTRGFQSEVQDAANAAKMPNYFNFLNKT